MPKSIIDPAQRVDILKAEIERAIGELRNLAVDPVDIRCGEHLSFEVRPAGDGDWLNVYRKDWGGTSVNYTGQGLILYVHASGEDSPIVHTASVFKEDLETEAGELDAFPSLEGPVQTNHQAVQHG